MTRIRQLSTRRPTTAPAEPTDAPAGPRTGRRRLVGWLLTTLAGLLVFLALVTPDNISRLPPGVSEPGAFVRIPIEGLAALALLLVLPGRARRRVAASLGVVLGLLTIVKVIDMGFFAALARPFNPVLDFVLFDDAIAFLSDSVGPAGTTGAVIAAVLLVIAVPVVMLLALRRLAGVAARHHTATTRVLAALSALWAVCAVLSVQIVPGVPVSSDSAAVFAYDKGLQVPAALKDKRTFAAEAAVDPFRDTPGDQLLTGLRGKDVVFSFVESYGRDAVEDPEFATQVGAVLDAGDRRLAAAGFAARSGYLTSSTAGGGSWLAHATFQSGLWINNEQRYRSLVSGDRLTLAGAFGRAGWRTVGVEPGVTYAWPEGQFYGYDKVYDSHTLGYRGPAFSWATMPDQYTMAQFQRDEYATAARGPVMAEITLVSSHTPWAPIPEFIDWADVGDGSVYGPMEKAGKSPGEVWGDPTKVRTEYRRSIEYTLNTLISYVQTYGNDNLVLVFLGDHQPAPIVTGDNASRDVPITIIAHDKAVLDKIAGWGWRDGLTPAPQPVWPMNEFRDRFLTAFGPHDAPTR